MRGSQARLAVLIAVSSDGHRVAALAFVEIGIGQARRAWLTRDQILNTRPWREIERMLRSSADRVRGVR